MSDIPGTYEAKYSFGTETLELNSDGSYIQVFASAGNSRTNIGTWTFHPAKEWLDGGSLILDDALIFGDGFGQPSKEVRKSTWALDVEGDTSKVMLVQGEDSAFS